MAPKESKRIRESGSALLWEKLSQENGEFTLNGAFKMLFYGMLLVLFLSVLGAMNDGMKLHSVAAELTRYIELRGQVDAPVDAELARLANVAGIAVDSCMIDTFTGDSKIQFGAPFTVTLKASAYFGIGGVLSVPVPLKSSVSGRGERYWK